MHTVVSDYQVPMHYKLDMLFSLESLYYFFTLLNLISSFFISMSEGDPFKI